MDSGVKLAPGWSNKFIPSKGKEKLKLKYIIYKIDQQNMHIAEEHEGKSGQTKQSEEEAYEEFIGHFPNNECRYAVYDFEFTNSEGGQRNKLIFFTWVPESAGERKESAEERKQKFLYASSEAVLRNAVGAIIQIHGTDYEGIAYATVLAKVSGTR